MMIVTARFSKKKAALAVIVAGAVVAAAVILVSFLQGSGTADLPELADNTQRVEYLRSLGWEVEPEPVETLQFLLPESLAEPYLSYNQLQKEQGFDLSECCGKQVNRYTYTVLNYPNRPEDVQINLYVCENRPAAGDIFCAGADGFQETLIYPESAS